MGLRGGPKAQDLGNLNVSFNPSLKSGKPGSADDTEDRTWIFQLKQRVNLPFLHSGPQWD